MTKLVVDGFEHRDFRMGSHTVAPTAALVCVRRFIRWTRTSTDFGQLLYADNRRNRVSVLLFFLVAAMVLAASFSTASAAVLNWTGSGANSNFNTAGNWNPAQIPTAVDNCTINSFTVNQPSIGTNATCGTLTLGTGATLVTLTFTGAQNLAVAGDVNIGANGRVAPSGSPTGVFSVGGNWSDDLSTTNLTGGAALTLDYLFTGSPSTLSTNEAFYDVRINGDVTLLTDFAVNHNLIISNTSSFDHGPNTITLNGISFSVVGSYTHTCASQLTINGSIALGAGVHYPTTVINSGGAATGANPVFIDCDLTISAGATLNTGINLFVEGDWINNGGAINPGTGLVHMSGVGTTIGGTVGTDFWHLVIGDGAGDSSTSPFDLVVNGDLTVLAGATLTLPANLDGTIGNNTIINGTLDLSGTTTWNQTGGTVVGISVAAGGLLRARGIDDANRVTFRQAGANYYNVTVNGGIDFEYVNVFHTRSASAPNRGFRLKSEPGDPVTFDYVTFDNTLDTAGAIMMQWDSNRSLDANGVVFNSATYLSADGDVNVEANSGTITFRDYGGNYAGEALDSDNGGFAEWVLSVADLQIAKTVDDATPTEGDTIVYSVVLDNNGPDASTNVAVTDLLPAGVTYVSDVPSKGSYVSGTGVWTVGGMSNGASESLAITATVDAGTATTTIVNTASVSASDETDPTPGNDSDTASITVQSATISGTVFEDVNYGGGVGRNLATAAADAPTFTVGRDGVTVELYDASGNFQNSTTTAVGGSYSFTGLSPANYTVRVVNDTVTSSRPGSDGSEIGVQTYRSDSMSESAGTGAKKVGGVFPSNEDAAANSGAQTLASLQSTDLDADGVPEWTQSIVTVDASGGDVTGVDFGFNFDVIVNTNDAGQGTLRQFILNSNLLN